MAAVTYGSLHGSGFSPAIKITLFFLVSISLLDSSSGCWGGRRDRNDKFDISAFQDKYRNKLQLGCDTTFAKEIVKDPEKAAKYLVEDANRLLAELHKRKLDEHHWSFNDKLPDHLLDVVSVDDEKLQGYNAAEREQNKLLRPEWEKFRQEKRKEKREKIKQLRGINKTFQDEKFDNGHSCIDGERPNEAEKLCDKTWQHRIVNKYISKKIGYRCKSGKCQFQHKKLEFVCGSTSHQAIAILVITAIFFLGCH